MESLNTLQDGQRIYQILDGGMAALLANEILTNLRCAEDGQLQLLPTATSAAREIAESEDARTEDKGAASPRILKRAVKSANGERILITATQTVRYGENECINLNTRSLFFFSFVPFGRTGKSEFAALTRSPSNERSWW